MSKISKDYIKTLLLFLLFVTYVLCVQQIDFTVIKISQSNSCLETIGKFYFEIEGEFSGEFSPSDFLYINLDSQVNSTVKCTPFVGTQYTNSGFQCTIDVCFTPLVSSDIYLPLSPPNSERFSILKWREIIGKTEGETNVVSKNTLAFLRNPIRFFLFL